MQHLLVFAQLLYELLDAILVKKRFFLRRLAAFVSEIDLDSGIKECQLAKSRSQALKFKFRCDREDRRIGEKRDQGTGRLLAFDFTDDFEFLRRLTLGEGHVINLAVARDLHFEPFRKRVGAFRADAVKAAGIFISAL